MVDDRIQEVILERWGSLSKGQNRMPLCVHVSERVQGEPKGMFLLKNQDSLSSVTVSTTCLLEVGLHWPD